jgi:hypothetical protein
MYEQNPNLTVPELYDIVVGKDETNPEICVSRGGELFLTPKSTIPGLTKKYILEKLIPYMDECQTVVELGCGWGHVLWLLQEMAPSKKLIGGDFSKQAVALGQRIFSDNPNISVERFDFFDKKWPILEKLDGKALVFTCHSIEQIPLIKSAINTFARYRQKIAYVVHLEPISELYGSDNLLDLMRRGYVKAANYNKDLLTCIKGMEANIIATEKDLMGHNPLNPTSLLVWNFQ